MSTEGDVLITAVQEFGIEIVNGVITLTAGFESAAQLAMFGGNIEDAARASTVTKQWWGNLLESDPVKQYRSRTQALLESLPATTGNLRLLEEAAAFDLNFFLSEGIADGLEISVSLVDVNRIAFTIKTTAEGVEQSFTFTQNWQAAESDAMDAATVIAAQFVNAENIQRPPFEASTKSLQLTSTLHVLETAAQAIGIVDEWTIALWWHATTGGQQTLLDIGPAAGNANRITLRQETDGLSVVVWNVTFLFKSYTVLFTPTVDQWFHTVITWDGIGDELRMYNDAVEGIEPGTLTKDTDIGGEHQADTVRSIAIIDGSAQAYSIALFSKVFTPAEVVALYNTRNELDLNFDFPPPYTGAAELQHWYRLGFQGEPNIGADYATSGSLDAISAGAIPVTDSNIETDFPS